MLHVFFTLATNCGNSSSKPRIDWKRTLPTEVLSIGAWRESFNFLSVVMHMPSYFDVWMF